MLTDTFQFRVLEMEDLEAFRKLRLLSLETDPASFGGTLDQENGQADAYWEERLSSSLILGAFKEEALVGMIGFNQKKGSKESHKGITWGFYVKPEFRSQGVGRWLLEALLVKVRENAEIEQVQLHVLSANEAAVHLYQSLGFVRYGVEEKAVKIDQTYFSRDYMVWFCS